MISPTHILLYFHLGHLPATPALTAILATGASGGHIAPAPSPLSAPGTIPTSPQVTENQCVCVCVCMCTHAGWLGCLNVLRPTWSKDLPTSPPFWSSPLTQSLPGGLSGPLLPVLGVQVGRRRGPCPFTSLPQGLPRSPPKVTTGLGLSAQTCALTSLPLSRASSRARPCPAPAPQEGRVGASTRSGLCV